jgi:hypothetical protein
MRRVIVGLGALVALVASAAAAPPVKARAKGLVVVDWRGGWSPPERTKVTEALALGLDAAGLDRVEAQVEGFRKDARFTGCISFDACRFEYARSTGAQFLFSVILVKQGRSRRAAATMFNVPLLAQSTVGVRKARTTPALLASARGLIVEMVERERRMPRGTLELASAPAGDAVFIDGHAAGVTNVIQTVYAGPHVVRIERKGAQPHIAKINVPPEKQIRYEARFEKSVVPALAGEK